MDESHDWLVSIAITLEKEKTKKRDSVFVIKYDICLCIMSRRSLRYLCAHCFLCTGRGPRVIAISLAYVRIIYTCPPVRYTYPPLCVYMYTLYLVDGTKQYNIYTRSSISAVYVHVCIITIYIIYIHICI